MHLGVRALSLRQSFQNEFRFLCFILTLRCIIARVDPSCSYAEVAAAVPCVGLEYNPTEQQCRARHQECCTFIKHSGVIKCFRKKIQPNSGSCPQAPILVSKPVINQFLQGEVILEMKVFSELQCWDYCLRHAHCKAYNYQYSMGEPLRACQLLSSDVGIPMAEKDFTYHIIGQTENRKILLGSMCH